MGSSSDADYKLRLAAKTIEQLNPEKKYRLTMIGNNQISVIADDSLTMPGTNDKNEDSNAEKRKIISELP